jgi:hypothetical protein
MDGRTRGRALAGSTRGLPLAALFRSSEHLAPKGSGTTSSTLTRWRSLVFAAAFAITLLSLSPVAHASDPWPFGWTAKQAGPMVLQYDYDLNLNLPQDQRETCNKLDYTDEAMRAFRFYNGTNWKVQMNFPEGAQNRRMIGDDLHSARKENSPVLRAAHPEDYRACAANIVFQGRFKPPHDTNPASYNNNEWVSSPYYLPQLGKIYSLNHQEFRGAEVHGGGAGDPWCEYPAGDSQARDKAYCWLASETTVNSDMPAACGIVTAPTNALGSCYTHSEAPPAPYSVPPDPPAPIPAQEPQQLVATIPYQYTKIWDSSLQPSDPGYYWGRHGYSQASNVLKGEGDQAPYYYFVSLVTGPWTTARPGVQEGGVCILRTSDITHPTSWMAWNGQSFGNRPSSPYVTPFNPAEHTCKPVAPGIGPWSLTYNTYLHKYMMLGTGTQTSPVTGQQVTGVYYGLSDDLINWSDFQLLMEAPTGGQNCTLDPIQYPVVLDPNDPAASATGTQNPNFDHPGRTPDLYFRHEYRMPTETDPCATEKNTLYPDSIPSNLARLPIEFRHRVVTLDLDQSGGVVSSDRRFDFVYNPDSEGSSGGYDGGRYQQVSTTTSTQYSYGQISSFKWHRGDDVWYGAAYKLPSNFLTVNGYAEVMKWRSDPAQNWGGIVLRSDDRFHFVRGTLSGGGTDIGNSFQVPVGRWSFVEVHQKLGDGATGSPPALTEVYVDGRLVMTTTSANMVAGDTGDISVAGFGIIYSPVTTTMGIDRAYVMGAQLGPIIGTSAYLAPKTPLGLRATSTQSEIVLSWNPPATGDPSVNGYNLYEKLADGNWANLGDVGSTTTFTREVHACESHTYRTTAYRSYSDGLNPPALNVTHGIPTAALTVKTPGCQ